MNNFRSNFDLNKRQRNGVFFLLFIILTLQIVFWFVDFSSKDVADVSEFKRLAFQNEMDSLVKNYILLIQIILQILKVINSE